MTETLLVGDNRLTGSLPKELGGLTLLATLDVKSNDIKSSIPSEIGLLIGLGEFTGNDAILCSQCW